MSYFQGFVLAVPTSNKQAYHEHAERFAPLFTEFGASRMVETWGEDVPEGKVTDFRRAVLAEDGEEVLFSWVEYPSKVACDAAYQKMMSDPRMEDAGESMPFDGKRMIIGGFAPLVEEETGGIAAYADGYLIPVPTASKQAYVQMAQTAAKVFLEHGATRVVESWQDDVPDGKVTDFRRAVQAQDDESVVFSFVEWPSKEARSPAGRPSWRTNG